MKKIVFYTEYYLIQKKTLFIIYDQIIKKYQFLKKFMFFNYLIINYKLSFFFVLNSILYKTQFSSSI